MKVICIGRNYAAHAAELGNAIPSEPVIFLKPSTAVLTGGKPFFYPEFSQNIHYECELVLRICRNGKAIEERFAHRYYDQVGVGIDFTARDLQDELKSRGLPWEKAKAFDHSAVVGEFLPVEVLPKGAPIAFYLRKNGAYVQQGTTDLMLFSFDRIIAEVSRYFRLLDGDLLFTGTPVGVGPVAKGDLLEAGIGKMHLLSCRVK